MAQAPHSLFKLLEIQSLDVHGAGDSSDERPKGDEERERFCKTAERKEAQIMTKRKKERKSVLF